MGGRGKNKRIKREKNMRERERDIKITKERER